LPDGLPGLLGMLAGRDEKRLADLHHVERVIGAARTTPDLGHRHI